MIVSQYFDAWWQPYVFFLVVGWLATDVWRFIGVGIGSRINENSEILVFVRCIATGLVAAVVANFLVFPSGALADVPLFMRLLAAGIGFICYLTMGGRVAVGIIVSELILALFIFGADYFTFK